MDAEAKKVALRAIPYGLYVLTSKDKEQFGAATINWVSQMSFSPPLLAVGVKADSNIHRIIKLSKRFTLNILGREQSAVAYSFFKPISLDGDTISGERFQLGENGCPILENAPAYIECILLDSIERGDHSIFVAEVVNAGVKVKPTGRADEATLLLKDLGEKVFYGG